MKEKYLAKRYWKEEIPPMSLVDQLSKKFDDVIDLSLGDPDLTTNKIIIDKTYEDMLNGHTKYTDFRGDAELRAEIINFYKEEYDYDIDDREIFVSSSGTHAMCLAFCAILDPDDEVIIHAPYYTYYTNQIKFAGGIPVILDCFEEENFQISPDRLEKLITERTKAILINTPNNPTGACISKDILEKISKIAEKYDLIVVADDIYTAFSYEEPFIPFTTLPSMGKRTITINSFSKDYTMTGWRVGNIIAPENIIKGINIINDAVMFTAPSMSQRAALHALQNRKIIQPPMVEEYRKRLYYAAQRINCIKNLSVLPPKGTFYLMINIKKMGIGSMEASELILNKAHVLMVPGTSFGECGEGYLRIACTKNIDILKEAFDRLEKIKELTE